MKLSNALNELAAEFKGDDLNVYTNAESPNLVLSVPVVKLKLYVTNPESLRKQDKKTAELLDRYNREGYIEALYQSISNLEKDSGAKTAIIRKFDLDHLDIEIVKEGGEYFVKYKTDDGKPYGNPIKLKGFKVRGN
jgi:hypothetical protein